MAETLHAIGPVERIANNPLFAGLEPQAVARVLEMATRTYHRAGETVIEHSTTQPVLYIVEAGLLFLVPRDGDGRSRLSEPGEVLNQRGYLCGDASPQRAVAVLPSIVIALDRRDVAELEGREPALVKRIAVNAVRSLMPDARPTARAAAI